MHPNSDKIVVKTENKCLPTIHDWNWNNLPNELRFICCQKLKFIERLAMRGTSKSTMDLVDHLKYEFEYGCFSQKFDGFHKVFKIELVGSSGNEQLITDWKDVRDCMKYIWRVGVFGRLIFNFDQYDANADFTSGAEVFIKTKKVDFRVSNSDFVIRMLQHMKPIDSIFLDTNNNANYPLDSILRDPRVKQARLIQFKNISVPNGLEKIPQMWIDTDANIGSTFYSSTRLVNSFSSLVTSFDGRIIYQSERNVRIRMDDSSKNILLDYINFFPNLFRMEIVSEAYKDSENTATARRAQFRQEFLPRNLNDSETNETESDEDEEDSEYESDDFIEDDVEEEEEDIDDDDETDVSEAE